MDYRLCTARQLAAIAAATGCPFDPVEPGYATPDRLAWRFVDAFPVAHIHGRDDWAVWYADERRRAHEELGHAEYFVHLEDWLKAGVAIAPIILGQGADGRCYVWDGCHRTAAARALGLATLPAIVGCHSPDNQTITDQDAARAVAR